MTTAKTASKATDAETPDVQPEQDALDVTDAETPETSQSFRKTLWTAGPAPMVPDYSVIVPGKRRPYKFQNGKLVVTDPGDYDFILRALGGKVFEEDWPEDKPALMNEQTGFAPRSFAAAQAHNRLLNN